MSGLITGLIGIIALLASLFCAFGAGIDIERSGKDAAGVPILFPLGLAIIAILLLLVHS